jgi:tetratricopeptide (TPR) repeat protein
LFKVIPIAASVWLLAASPLLAERARVADSAAAEREFRRGLSALQDFEYEEANDAFARARTLDPGLAPAYWGEAMTYHQSLWWHEDLDAGRRALARLGPTPAARAAQCRSRLEADLLGAVEILFGPGDPTSRRRHYADAMARVFAQHSDDPDTAAFYALAMLGTMSRSLVGSDAHEGRSEGLAGSDTQARVAAILERVLQSHPDHRGALHYLLHTYDDPLHARQALAAARAYAKIAADSSHAVHMPAHIFLQLGMWPDAAASDRASFAASDRWVARRHLGSAMRNYHALAWLQYELLQLGRYREASDTIGTLEPSVKGASNLTLQSDLSSMRARFVIETRRWQLMGGEQNFANVNDLFAIGISAARTGNTAQADRARKVLEARAQAADEGALRPAISIMAQELAAVIALAAGRGDEALSILRDAADAEIALPPPLGLPAPIKPAPELLGEVLLEFSRPGEAIEWFERALLRNANRSLSVLGLARALAAVGRTDDARRRYTEVLANFEHADPDLPELNEARAALQTSGPAATPADRTRSRLLALALGVAAAAIGAVLIVRRRGRRPEKERPAPVKGAGHKAATKRKRQKR